MAKVLFISTYKPPTDKNPSVDTKAVEVSDPKVTSAKDNKKVSWGWLSIHQFFLPANVTKIQLVCRDWKEVGRRNEFWQPFLKKDITTIFKSESFYHIFKDHFELRRHEYLAQAHFVREYKVHIRVALLSVLEPDPKNTLGYFTKLDLTELCKNKIFLEAIFREPTLFENLKKLCNRFNRPLIHHDGEIGEVPVFSADFVGNLKSLFSGRKILSSLDLLTWRNLRAIFIACHNLEEVNERFGVRRSIIEKLFHDPVSNLGYQLLRINIQKNDVMLLKDYGFVIEQLNYPFATAKHINDDTIIAACELELNKLNRNSPTYLKDLMAAQKTVIDNLKKMIPKPSNKCVVM